jgi:hypothetical protein
MANIDSTQAFTFTDAQGATVSIPRNEMAVYAAIRTEQLSTLTSLIHDQVAGNQIELSEIDLTHLASLASELAHASKKIAFEISDKGGV